jgi:poly(A) polymerase
MLFFMMVSEPHDLSVESAADPVEIVSIAQPDLPEVVPPETGADTVSQDVPPPVDAEMPSLLDAAGINVAWDDEISPAINDVAESGVDAVVPQAMRDELSVEAAIDADVPAVSAEASMPFAEVPFSEREPWVPPADYVPSPFAIPRDQHSVSRKHISKNALSVLYRLHESGYRALLVGGGVRDVLLGRAPKDFDIATDATPEQVRRLFRNCRLIGRRFRLAHVLFGRDVVEVATFRASGEDEPGRQADESGRLLRDNVYGTIEDDVPRRDFTVNALYYDIADFSVLDHVGGMQDLRDGVLRLLGDPETRYREDPVRMLRAARFAAKLGFKLHEDTEKPIAELSSLLAGIPPARLIDECIKLFHTGHGAASLNELVRLDLLRWLLPPLYEAMSQVEDDGAAWAFLYAALSNTDRRVAEGLPLSTAFLFAALLWPVVVMQAQAHAHAGQPEAMLLQQAGDDVLHQIQPHVSIPRHLQLLIREIWEMQVRFVVHQGRGVASLHGHPRFRAAYDFLLLRAQIGEPQAIEDAAWWQAFVESGADSSQVFGAAEKGRSKRRRSSRRRKGADGAVVVEEADIDADNVGHEPADAGCVEFDAQDVQPEVVVVADEQHEVALTAEGLDEKDPAREIALLVAESPAPVPDTQLDTPLGATPVEVMPETPSLPADGADAVPEAEPEAGHDAEQVSTEVGVEAEVATSAVVVDADGSESVSPPLEHDPAAPVCPPPAAV